MKKLTEMSRLELTKFLELVNRLADEIQLKDERGGESRPFTESVKPLFFDDRRNPDLADAERQAKEFAGARREGRLYRSDYGLTDDDKSIIQTTRDYIKNYGKKLRGKVRR